MNLKLLHPSSKQAAKRYGPFPVIKVISPVIYCLKLSSSWKIFDTFYTFLLSSYKETKEHRSNFTRPSPKLVNGAKKYEVKLILGQRTYRQ